MIWQLRAMLCELFILWAFAIQPKGYKSSIELGIEFALDRLERS